ncbi:MAG: tryptophanase [Gracilibacteraceae bacterium]|nr:tryptophanase [Gracilibacteraceae bacterium]
MANVNFFCNEQIPLEMHKVRIVQKLELPPVERRLKAMNEAGNNTFLLKNRDVFMDMLTDSGVNAMSDRQQAAMLIADDSYAGSETFFRLESKLNEIFGMKYFLPAHQGRACENIISQTLVKPGMIVPMNYHFTTTKSHIVLNGGIVEELVSDAGLEPASTNLFKGNMDIAKLNTLIDKHGPDKIAFVRMEAGTNLIGGQPFSLENLEKVRSICDNYGITLVLDASLLADNLYFIKCREEQYTHASIKEITLKIASLCDIIYFSARKLGCARGGGICTSNTELFEKMRELVPLYEGFLTYGGMSVREMEALTVGLDETMDEDIISQGPQFIAFMVNELVKKGVPVITPPGGLGCHINAMEFLKHIPQDQYPAGALAAAFYIASGVRGMERGTMSEQRNPDGSEVLSNMELLRLAMPRRVYTLSQVKYAVDRMVWLYENRNLIEGLSFTEEPKILRFFFGRLKPVSNWQENLVAKFRKDFGDSL